MLNLLDVVARVVIAIAVMASVSFVVGSVVAFQYHSMLLGQELLNQHKGLVRRWYTVGALLSGVALFIVDSERSTSHYLLVLAGLVIVFWFCWWAHARWVMRSEISKRGVGWELFWSSFSVSVVSGITGIAMVDQIFKWFGWRN